ncbi:TetR/AcrR family transcriptional regulator [Brevibacterium sp. ZH18]|uniref:TetR/AcrR family transcriptional regulator n=1 Tax=Brevibacterium sp. ZH18 TaxID=2927784 RepID=UPI001F61EE8E|nr:TetR/AcrR family transcriptional regulator [Brevibacterium sp. ZH18]MCI4011903.1 TetR/AcrR family transcriptional regulator [Brevibacterium sp. ZH18]
MNTDNLSARRKQTRSTLAEAGISVFAVKGIAGASIEEICEAGGLTRGAFYSNFSSRDELVLAAIEVRTSETLDRLDLTIQRWKDRLDSEVVEDIEDLLTTFVQETFNEERQTAARVIAEQEIELYCLRVPQLYARYQELNSYQLERLSALVATALDIIGATTKIPTESLLTVLISVYQQTALQALAGMQLQDPIDIDPGLIVQVLLQLLEFPQCPDDPEAGEHDGSSGAGRA